MNNLLYKANVECPICSREFEVSKVKYSSMRPQKTDTDFLVCYKELNPLIYEVLVCEYCGYAEFQDKFGVITNAEKELVKKSINSKWVEKSYSGERDIDKAVETYKILYINQKVRNAPASSVARCIIRIAWLYRSINDSRERDYLIWAAKFYSDAFLQEAFPIGKMDEATCLYIIGESYRRAQKYEDALKWFSQTISLPPNKKNPKISEMVRDQMDETKKELKLREKEANDEGTKTT